MFTKPKILKMKKLLFLPILFLLGFSITNLQAQGEICDVEAGEPTTDVASLCGEDLANLDFSDLFGPSSGGYTDSLGNFDPAATDFISIAVDGTGNIVAISLGGILDLSMLAAGQTVDIYAIAYSSVTIGQAAEDICSIAFLNVLFDCASLPITDIGVFLDFIRPAFNSMTLQDVLDILMNQSITIIVGDAEVEVPLPLCADVSIGSISVTIIDAFAGTLTLDPLPDPSCVPSSGSYVISATPNGDASTPADFETLYVLTDGNGDIVATSASPSFDLVALGLAGGSYTIHTLIAETTDTASPDYIDLSGLIIPSPVADFIAAADASGACYALDVAGANTGDLETCCEADAGSLTLDDLPGLGCIPPGEAYQICATPNGDSNVPAGYSTLYVLTSGGAVLGTDAGSCFDVTDAGSYTIHTLVYDPNTLDLTGVATVADLLAAGAGVCYALSDVGTGAVSVDLEECIPCTITATGPCNDQGTEDTDDDTYEIVIDVSGTGVASYQVSGDVTTSAPAGMTSVLGPFPTIMIIDITVTALDADGNEICSDAISSLEICECENKVVPTLSQWGLIILALLLLNLGVLYIRQTDPKLAIVKA